MGAAMAIVREVGGDAEQVVASMRLARERLPGAQEPVVAFLEQVVSQRPVAGDAREIGPHLARRAVVERAERVLVHLKRVYRGGRDAVQAFELTDGQFAREHVLTMIRLRCMAGS